MKKRINILLIGVLTVASIILALPFTPLRNSFKGVTSNAADKALTSLGVDLRGKIKNARQISDAHQYEASNMDLGLIVDSKGRIVKSVNFSSVSYSADAYNANILNSTDKSGNSSRLNSAYNASEKTSTSSSQGFGGFVPIQSKSGGSTTNSSALAAGEQSVNAGTSNGVRQSGHAGPPPGEGGGTPPPPSLPLGDGTTILLVLISLVGIWKAKSVIA
ncbi:MAG: hypothetical protein WCG08_02460 [Paludibacter sp.]